MIEELTALGFTKEEILDRVVERIASKLMCEVSEEEDDSWPKSFETRVRATTKEMVDEAVARMAEQHVLPNVSEYIEQITLQATNRWGEPKGEALTFVEYLVERAEAYMTEKVDHSGKTKDDQYSSSYWKGTQTRITYLIHEHLQYNIEQAMGEALKKVNDSIAEGLRKTVQMKVAEIAEKLKVSVDVKEGR